MSRSVLASRILVAVSLAALVGGSPMATAQEGKPADPKPTTAKRPDIYDEKADAEKQVADALAVAKRDNTRVLLMFGGNWCGWCHLLHDVFKKDAEIVETLGNEYEIVMIDTAAPNAQAVIDRYEAIPDGAGVPFLTILDADGKLVANQATGPLEEGGRHNPKKVLSVLEQHKVPAVDAQKALDEALGRARSEGKKVFLHFGAPWCGWCHKLDAFLIREDMKAILDKEFIDLKIDIDRMTGGKEVMLKIRGAEAGGIPWFAFLDGQGKALATSDGPEGNVGFPYQPAEVDHFLGMLKQSTELTPEQLAAIAKALTEKPAAD
jgi:thioredoxin-related protein